MKVATFIAIVGRSQIDKFMKAADLFNGKNLGEIQEVDITFEENTALSLERAADLIDVLKLGLEVNGEFIVSFIHLVRVQNNETITLNTKIKPYFDPQAREISNGKTSFMMKQFIEKVTPFKCKTNANYYITEII